MAGNNTPPINNKELRPLQGSSEFRVITLGLQEVVKEGLDKGMGVNRLAKEINEGILATSNVKVSGMAILRWSKVYYAEDQRETVGSAINLGNHYEDILNQLTKQIDIQAVIIDELSKESAKSVGDIVNLSKCLNASQTTIEKLMSRKLVILGTITAIQEKVLGYMAASEVVQITLQAVQDKDRVLYDEIMGSLRQNKEYMELFRTIMPTK